MKTFHINGQGQPALCTAMQRPCPLGGDHYDSMENAAQALMERDMGITSSSVPTAVTPSATDSWTYGEIRVRELPRGIRRDSNLAVLPAGRYLLGDPCYSAGRDDDSWQKWVEVADRTSKGFTDAIVGASYNGYPVIGASTKYGDGTYWGSNGEEYAVDAGMIGVVPEEVVRGLNLHDDELKDSGTWVTVNDPTRLGVDDDGTIYFGSISIFTGDDEVDDGYY